MRRGLFVCSLVAGLIALTGAPGSAVPNRPWTSVPPKVKPGVTGATVTPTTIPRNGSILAPNGASRLGFCGGDDWEPEVATGAGGFVYVVWSHFAGDPACDPASANPNRVEIQVSSDGARTFGPPHVVADAPGGVNYPSQVDSVVTVDDVTGAVHVTFLAYGIQGPATDVIAATSFDHGATFASARINGPDCTKCDHPWPVAHAGQVYVAYAQGKDHFISRSSDGGATWTETRVLTADTVAFPEGAVLDAAGNAWFAWGDCKTSSCGGNTAGDYRVSRTTAGTSQTTFTLVASAPAGPKCPYAPNCGFAYFGIQDDIAIDAAGTLYLVWQDGQDHAKAGSPPVVELSRSTDGGATWQLVGRVDDKGASGCAASACYALFPRVEGGSAGRISAMWMDDRLGAPLDHTNGWNVWLRSSANGGLSWAGPGRRVSSYDPSRPESQPNGFLFPYGDYEGIDLDGTRATMIWGEGVNYTGGPSQPGHIVYASF